MSYEEIAEIVTQSIESNEDDEGKFQHFILKISWKKDFLSIISTNAEKV
jgi:hypothetical protein